MKFTAKYLKKAGQVVYVLMMRDKDRNGHNNEAPIGVVTDEALVKKFYSEERTKDERNYYEFVLNDLPMVTGEPGTHELPEPAQPPQPDPAMQQKLDAANKKIAEMQKMLDVANRRVVEAERKVNAANTMLQGFLEKMKAKRVSL